MSDITKLSNKEIDAKIAELQEESIGLSVDYMADPEYKQLIQRLSEIKLEYFTKHAERQEVIGDEIRNYTEELQRRKEEKKRPLKLSDEMFKLVQEMHRGVNYGPRGLIPVAVWDERFILIKKPGHNGWAGRGQSSHIPTSYTIHDLQDFMNGSVTGYTLYYKSVIWEAPAGTKIGKIMKNADDIIDVFRNAG